jgi:SARP family transcriptional regulator, regulator of embCAB operon
VLHFRVLGALDVQGPNKRAEPATPKVAAVLSLLLSRPNQIVSTSAIIDEVWGEDAPRSATATTQTYIYQLRKFLRDLDELVDDAEDCLDTRPPGYVLRLAPGQLDAVELEDRAREGRSLIDEGRDEEAAETLRAAIALRRGPVLGNVCHGPVLRAYVTKLEETLLRARELYVQAQFSLGRHREMVSELAAMAQLYPLNEWIHGRLIHALTWSGRRADALRAYRQLRHNLTEELGIDPSPELQRLELDVLEGDLPTPAAGSARRRMAALASRL